MKDAVKHDNRVKHEYRTRASTTDRVRDWVGKKVMNWGINTAMKIHTDAYHDILSAARSDTDE